jgi:NAD(P)-dependent dehydrogenase (short-subunit alcohol dehydrogenase family)
MILDRFSLKDKVAIVTGAGTGIGHGISIGLAEAGAHIVCAARTAAPLEATAEKVRALSRRALVVPTDVTRSQTIDNLVARTMHEFGRIDILVNNAAAGTPARSLDVTESEWEEVIHVCLTGVFLCSKAVARVMREQKGGNIINISSGAGVEGAAKQAAYSSAKAGVITLTRSLAWEWAPYNIRVNCIAPGMVLHERTEGFFDIVPQWMDFQAIKRFGTPEDIAAACVYLASDASEWVTGQTFNIDGGSHTPAEVDDSIIDAIRAAFG